MKPTVAELDQVGARVRDVLADAGLEVVENVHADLPADLMVAAADAQEAGQLLVVLAAEVTHGLVSAAVIARKRPG